MRKNIKRVIAGVLSAVLSLSLVNFSALSMSLASELSGYEIGVEYSEDNTSATLVGNTTGLKEGVQLDKLVDSDGQELDPTSFSQTVEENGTYHFTLYYQETVETQDADQPTTEEKTQELEVVVDGIGKPKADQPQQPEVLEGVQMGTEDEKDAPSPFVQKVESMTAAPRTVPLDLLQRNMAQARASKWIEIRANEADYKLQSLEFGGGPLVVGAEGLPTVNGRTFVRADFIINGTTITRAINGLYSYNDQWYYTVDGNTVDGGAAGNLYVGFELPADATVRLYYEMTGREKKWLNAYGSGADLASEYKMYLNGQQNYYLLGYFPGTKIVLDFVMPLTLRDLTINISNVGDFNIGSAKELGNKALTENQIWRTSSKNYTLVFTMPDKDVNINFNGTQWTNSDIRQFAIGSDFQPERGESFNNTQVTSYNNTWGSFFRSIPYNVNNSPGIVDNASVTHVDGRMEYSPRTSFQVYNQGGSVTRTMLFAGGSYRSGQMVGFELKMDRRDKNGAYVWKPNSLVLNAYIGEPYTGSNKNFRQYVIELAYTEALTTDSTKDTYLDCGARVRTQCRGWTNDYYYYRIFVYDMTHNFTLYDRPAKTNQQNFVLGKMNGIELAAPTSTSTNGVSYVSNGGPYAGGARPLRVALDLQDAWMQDKGTARQTNFYVRSKYGYTAPERSITNKNANTWLSPIGMVSGSGGLYQYQMQVEESETDGATKGPALIDFSASPLKFNVGYYKNGKQYFNPQITMSAAQNSFYSVQEKIQQGQKLKGYKVVVNTTYYESGKTNVKKTEDVIIPPPNDPNNEGAYWYPNKIISFSYVYNYLQGKGKVPINESTQMRINPDYVTSGEPVVQAKWELKEQTKFAELDNNADNRNLTAANATVTPKNINAYVGSTVSLYGNKEWYQNKTTGKYYLYNEAASRPVGTVTAGNPIVASLEYVLATKATVTTSTLGNQNNYNSWKSNIEGKWFTSIGNFNHIINISALKPGTKDGMVFDEWEIVAGGSTFKLNRETMVWNDNGTEYLSLAKIGRREPTLWSKIFDSGTFALQASWKSNVEPIKNVQGTNALVTNTPAYVVDGDTNGFEISAVFKYGTKTVVSGNNAGTNQVLLSEIQSKINSNDIKLVVLKKNANAGETNPWNLWYSENAAQANTGTQKFPIARKEITVDADSGGFKVTFKVKENSAIDPVYEDGAVYRIFAWSEANDTNKNQNLGTLTGSQLKDAMNGNTSAILNLIPCVKTDVKELQKVTLKNGGLTNQDGGTVYFVDGQSDALSITGEFKYGNGTATRDEIQQMFDAGALKIALIKKNPPSQTGGWQVRFGPDSPINSAFEGPAITKDNGSQTFKVTFTVSGPIGAQYNDGANFRIFAWTAAHEGMANLTAAQIATALQGNDNPYDGKIPSVNVSASMLRKVTVRNGDTENLITDVPNKNVYIKNGAASFQITAEFKYGDGSATEEVLQKMVTDGALKVALVKKNPPGQTQTWQARSGPGMTNNNGFEGPVITKEDGSSYFKITFTVNQNVTKEWNDGANFKIFAWTAAHEGMAGLTAAQIAQALTNADAAVNEDTPYVNPYEGKVPSVNTTTYWLYGVKNEGGVDGPVKEKALEVYDGTSFQLTSNFRYGDTTADETKLNDLFDDGALKVVLLKKDPQIGETPVKWADRYGGSNQPFGKPTITKAADSEDFTVSFTVDKSKVTGEFNDGAQFRILVWTDVNATNTDGTSITVTNILDVLNQTEAANKPDISGIPWEHFNLSMLYRVQEKADTSTVSPKATDSNVALTTTFHYDFDANRYPNNAFTHDMLQALIDDGTIKVKLQRKTPTADWSEVTGLTNSLTAGEDGTGTITFSHTLSGNVFDYHKNQFRVKVWTEANGTVEESYPSHTFTVNVDIKEVTSADGSKTNKDGTGITILDKVTQSYQVVGTFKYGTETIDQDVLDQAFGSNKLQIALLFKDPAIQGQAAPTWQVRYKNGQQGAYFGEPDIQYVSDSTFTVTFTSSQGLSEKWMDGGNFRIFAWTEANQDGASLTAESIAQQLNAANGGNPFDTKVPSVNVLTEKVYQIQDKTDAAAPFSAEATQSDVALTTTFHYDYDTNRYPSGFDQGTLQKLIADGDIKVKLEKKTTADGDWTPVEVETNLITAGANGTINFSYTLTGKFYSYDNQQFKVSVWTAANGSTYPSYTFTVDASPSKILSADGSIGNQVIGTPIVIKDGQAEDLTVTAEFMYGDGTAPAEDIDKMVKAGLIHIALLIKDPTTGGKWQVRYPVDGTADFAGPDITAGKSGTTFQVTFTEESSQLAGMWSDGAEFLIYAWTGANQGGTDLTANAIVTALNGSKEEKPYQSLYAGEVPSVYTYTTKLYKIADKSDKTTETADVLDKTLTLTTTFHYNYDTGRYPNGFDQKTLQKLIDDGEIKVSVGKKASASDASWTPVTVEDGMFTPDGQGNITFTYTISAAKISDFLAYEGNQFKVSVWTAANGEPYPSHTFTVDITVDPINNEGGATSSQPENVEGNVGGPLTLKASFRYGDGTATPGQIQALIDAKVIKIALVKIEPDKNPPPDQEEAYRVSWHDVQYGDGTAIPKPDITQEPDAPLDFKISFQVSQRLGGWDDDGAQFRIYVWTEANGTSTDVSSITGTDIANDLNSTAGGAEPAITEIPWVHYNLTLLYKVVNNGTDTSKTVSVLSTATSIPLTGTFKYEYDTNRYFWEQFTATMLQDLIDAKKFNVEIQVTKKGSTESVTKTLTPEEVIASLSAADNGIINFTYGFQDGTSTDLSAYDGATFEVKVSTAANGSVIPVYTITVTYIADPSTYVNIPEYVILEDDKSKVVDSKGRQQDGYAGKSAEVTYNTTAGTQVKPEVTVKVQDGVKLQQGSHNGPEMLNMAIGIYDATGVKIQAGDDGYSSIGTLSESNKTITFWMNTPRGTAMKNEQYYAIVNYLFELNGTTT